MSRVVRMLLTASAIASLLFSVVALVVRAMPLSSLAALVIAVASPYAALAALSAVVLAAVRRRFVLAGFALVVTAATLAVQVPWYYLGRPADVGTHIDVRVLSSNLRKGRADAVTFVALAGRSADVITVSELTPEEVQRLIQVGIGSQFPYSALTPEPGAAGIGLWSRYPLTAVAPAGGQDNIAIVSARMQVPGVRFDPLVSSVHVISPVASDQDAFASWRRGIAEIKSNLADLADSAERAAVIIGGDFNSTPDMRQFRDLVTNGYRDAVQQTGAGFAPTFPSNRRFFPPVITIDHVLTRSAAASSIKTVKIPGSDHRSLLATVQVPLDPTAS